jgi:hypothetical protein
VLSENSVEIIGSYQYLAHDKVHAEKEVAMKIQRYLIIFPLLFGLFVGCSTIPRGFEIAPDQSLVHQASGTVFLKQIASFTRTRPVRYNAEGTDISVNYQSEPPLVSNLDMYVFPASTKDGPIGLKNQHADYVRRIVSMHPGTVVESDEDVQVTQAGGLRYVKQAIFTYSGVLGGKRQPLFSILIEFEYKGWFISYRMDAPIEGREKARALLAEFISTAPLPSKGYTPKVDDFFGLVWTGTPESIQAAIDNGADVNARNKDGKTPLMFAAGYAPNPEVINILLAAGAEVNAKEPKYGLTPLMFAVAANTNPEVATTLLNAGADLGARSQGGVTVLMWAAVYTENPEIISLLLKAGSDAKARNDAGKTAIEGAQQNTRLKGTDAYRQLQEASK